MSINGDEAGARWFRELAILEYGYLYGFQKGPRLILGMKVERTFNVDLEGWNVRSALI